MPETPTGTVLILEDDAGIAQLERRRLERAGFSVAVSSSAEEARAALAAGGVDLMVLDYKLNEAATGLDFYRDLSETGLGVPSILVTGFADEAMLARALREGVRDFLPKTPDYLDFLVPAVVRVMDQIRIERELHLQREQLFREQAARLEAEAERKALAEEDRRKDEFLAMLAHELRNPLSAISSAVNLARATPSDEHRDWSNEVITRQVKHLTHLIDDLLDVSRIRLGKIQLRRQPLEAAEVMARAVETVRPLLERKRHGLAVSIEPGPLRVDADPTRLEQVLVNLLTNAAKYTDEGGRIAISAGRDGPNVAFRVKDNGTGIPREMLPRIFDLFIQVDRSLDRSQGGLGIGLTLVRKLVESHGGTVSATSAGPGLGSEFVVRLPALSDSVHVAPSSSNSGRRPTMAENSKRVLVVDDNIDAARGLARLLKVEGHDLAIAHDGREALDAARAHRAEVILLDIGLPGLDGYQVAEILRREGFADATIIAVSGYGQDEDRKRSERAGFNHHLVKPVDHDFLLRLIAGA